MPISPPKSALIVYLINGYKKSVRTCHAHHIVGIAKHRSKNKQKQIPHAVCIHFAKYSMGLYAYNHIQKQNGRIFVSILLQSSFWRFYRIE